jgi:hypothetical protein
MRVKRVAAIGDFWARFTKKCVGPYRNNSGFLNERTLRNFVLGILNKYDRSHKNFDNI